MRILMMQESFGRGIWGPLGIMRCACTSAVDMSGCWSRNPILVAWSSSKTPLGCFNDDCG